MVVEQVQNETEEQAGEGYGCSCGFKTKDKGQFTKHVMISARRDGKGTHKSIGRVNMLTGEVVLPPWLERTNEQKRHSKFAQEKKGGGPQQTNILADATSLKFVPRVYTVPFTPIMNMAREAAIREWGWPIDMALEDFLDTVIYHMFNDRDITLIGYIVKNKYEGGGNGSH